MGNLAHAIGNGGIFNEALRALRVRLPRRLPEVRPDDPSEAEGAPRRSFLDRLRKLPWWWWLALAVVIFGLAIIAVPALAGTTFTVNSIADTGDATPDGVCNDGSGNCTLREAIQEANAHPISLCSLMGPDIINFNIGGSGVQTITLASPLPIIDDPVTIDGYSQGDGTADDATPNTQTTGNDARLLIELDGEHAAPPPGDDQNHFSAQPRGLFLGFGSAGSTVRGLVINRFEQEGIFIGT